MSLELERDVLQLHNLIVAVVKVLDCSPESAANHNRGKVFLGRGGRKTVNQIPYTYVTPTDQLARVPSQPKQSVARVY